MGLASSKSPKYQSFDLLAVDVVVAVIALAGYVAGSSVVHYDAVAAKGSVVAKNVASKRYWDQNC